MKFPRLVGRYCSYLLPKQAGGTPQIIVDKTSRMTGRLRVYKLLICKHFLSIGNLEWFLMPKLKPNYFYWILTQTGNIAVVMDFVGHSRDCDCDEQTWDCSRENTVGGRTPVTAVGRFTLTPSGKTWSIFSPLWPTKLSHGKKLTALPKWPTK